jgi:hypothetical protein
VVGDGELAILLHDADIVIMRAFERPRVGPGGVVGGVPGLDGGGNRALLLVVSSIMP